MIAASHNAKIGHPLSMRPHKKLLFALEYIQKIDSRYPMGAYVFLSEALEFMLSSADFEDKIRLLMDEERSEARLEEGVWAQWEREKEEQRAQASLSSSEGVLSRQEGAFFSLEGREKRELPSNIRGEDLVRGFCQYALFRFGASAFFVFLQWNLREGLDVGAMVFNLIGVGIFGKDERDKFEDFDTELSLEQFLTYYQGRAPFFYE